MSLMLNLEKNWLGNKRQKGDKVTPEGQYKITDKKKKIPVLSIIKRC